MILQGIINPFIEIILIPYRITTCFNNYNLVMHVYSTVYVRNEISDCERVSYTSIFNILDVK